MLEYINDRILCAYNPWFVFILKFRFHKKLHNIIISQIVQKTLIFKIVFIAQIITKT